MKEDASSTKGSGTLREEDATAEKGYTDRLGWVDTVRVWSFVPPIFLGRKCDATRFTDKGMLLHYYSALCCQIVRPKDGRCGVPLKFICTKDPGTDWI
jgi:hypothetical protein